MEVNMTRKLAIALALMVLSAYASHTDLQQQENQLLSQPFEHKTFREYIGKLCENYEKRDTSELLGFSVGTLDEYLENKGNQQFAEKCFMALRERKGAVAILQAKDHTPATPLTSVSHSWESLFRTAVRENTLVPNTFKDPATMRAYITFLISEIPDRATDFDKIMSNLLGCYEVDLRHINRLREPELYRMYECFRDFYRYQRKEQLLSQAVAVKELEMLAEAAKREAEEKRSWTNVFCGFSWWRTPTSPRAPHGYEALKKRE